MPSSTSFHPAKTRKDRRFVTYRPCVGNIRSLLSLWMASTARLWYAESHRVLAKGGRFVEVEKSRNLVMAFASACGAARVQCSTRRLLPRHKASGEFKE